LADKRNTKKHTHLFLLSEKGIAGFLDIVFELNVFGCEFVFFFFSSFHNFGADLSLVIPFFKLRGLKDSMEFKNAGRFPSFRGAEAEGAAGGGGAGAGGGGGADGADAETGARCAGALTGGAAGTDEAGGTDEVVPGASCMLERGRLGTFLLNQISSADL
jgi:hypothetical protein